MMTEEQIRADERERCAKAIEADRDRVSGSEGLMLGESCIYDVCAITVRERGTSALSQRPEGITSGLGIIEGMFGRGDIDEATRSRLAKEHLESVYGTMAALPNSVAPGDAPKEGT